VERDWQRPYVKCFLTPRPPYPDATGRAIAIFHIQLPDRLFFHFQIPITQQYLHRTSATANDTNAQTFH
jgi:hypothetical protein